MVNNNKIIQYKFLSLTYMSIQGNATDMSGIISTYPAKKNTNGLVHLQIGQNH